MNWRSRVAREQRFMSVGDKKQTHQFVIEVSIVFGEGAEISSVVGKKRREGSAGVSLGQKL